VRLGVAGCLQTSRQWNAFEVAALFSAVRPAFLLLQNINLSVRSSLRSFLSFLLTFLSYSSGLPHLAAVRCPSTPLRLNCSFLTLPCPIPCGEGTFTSPRVATPRGTAKSPRKQTSEAAPYKRASEDIPPFALALLAAHALTAAVPISHTSLLPSCLSLRYQVLMELL